MVQNSSYNNNRSKVVLNHLYPERSSSSESLSSVKSKSFYVDETSFAKCNNSNSISHNSTCGIISFVSSAKSGENASQYLMEGLTILQNRGYDSAGICTIEASEKDPSKNKLVVSKFASTNTTSDALNRLQGSVGRHSSHHIGIAHTRWATHGGKTDVNAHPHIDRYGRIALVHNGVIENSNEIKQMLKKKYNTKCSSETDTEVVVQLIGQYVHDGLPVLDAIQKALGELEGTWGFVILDAHDDSRLYAVRNGSPLLLGVSNGKSFVASESSAFGRHTSDMIALENGEIAILSAKGVESLIGNNTGNNVKDRIQKVEHQEIKLSPHPYPHWTIREIYEQPEAASRSLNFGGRFANDTDVRLGGLEANKDWLLKIRHLVIAACGTSFYASRYGARLFRALKCFDTVQVIDAAELDTEDLPSEDGGLLVISQSGETSDVMRCLNIAQELKVPNFSIVNRVGSLIARTTGCGVYINAGRENAVASTKAFLCQVTVFALVALFFAQNSSHKTALLQQRKELVSCLHRLPTSVGMSINGVHNKCKSLAQKLKQHNTMFILGKGYGEPIAYEGSLKIKEITYTHAEAYSSGALKHGPFALIDDGTPIFIIILNDKYRALNITAAHEVKCRGAYVIGITDCKEQAKEVCSEIIEIPSNSHMTSVLATIPLQLIAYELSVLKGIDPDKPRHLAKSVTVY